MPTTSRRSPPMSKWFPEGRHNAKVGIIMKPNPPQPVLLADLGEHAGEVTGFNQSTVPSGEGVAGIDPGKALLYAQTLVRFLILLECTDTEIRQGNRPIGAPRFGWQSGQSAIDPVHTSGDADGALIEVDIRPSNALSTARPAPSSHFVTPGRPSQPDFPCPTRARSDGQPR